MTGQRTVTAILKKEGDFFVAECPEVGAVSQGLSPDEAVVNLKEATELFLEEFPQRLSQSEIRREPGS
jgi:predicted RNase H-like HicB family nuclease